VLLLSHIQTFTLISGGNIHYWRGCSVPAGWAALCADHLHTPTTYAWPWSGVLSGARRVVPLCHFPHTYRRQLCAVPAGLVCSRWQGGRCRGLPNSHICGAAPHLLSRRARRHQPHLCARRCAGQVRYTHGGVVARPHTRTVLLFTHIIMKLIIAEPAPLLRAAIAAHVRDGVGPMIM
jgi:hypothetical protein